MESTPVRSRGPKLLRWSLRIFVLILVALLATFALYKWWQRREEDHARLMPEVPEPWAPPDYSIPVPTSSESDSVVDDGTQTVVDEAELEPALEIDTKILTPVVNDVHEDHAGFEGLKADQTAEPMLEGNSAEPVSESVDTSDRSHILSVGIAASRDRRSSRTAKAPSPLPDENFIPSASMPAMPWPNWEPPVGR
jgi:hypothetical protein